MTVRPGPGWRDDARATIALAWPVLVGQVAVLGFSTVDTLLAARSSAEDLATLALSLATYITVFIGLMGAVAALSPIVGQLYGAGRRAEAGHQLHQSVWLALALSVPGCGLLLWPEPLLALAQASPPVAAKVHRYLATLALGLPAALLFGAFRGFSTAVSKPKPVMTLQLAGFALKLPLSALLVFGLGEPGGPGLTVPALGVMGCALSTVIVLWLQMGMAALWLRRDPFYVPFEVPMRQRLQGPHRVALAAQLRLGLPIAASLLIETTGFSFMAVFIARLGTVPLASHQIAANVAALLFMMPLALSNASSTLVAQAVGAGRLHDARRIGWHGIGLGVGLAAAVGLALWLARPAVVRLYGSEPAVASVALTLLAWVAIFHVADAGQAVTAGVLRAWRIATVPMLIYAVAVWGVGLGGGYALALADLHDVPPAWSGARGFWIAAAAGLLLAALALMAWLHSTTQAALRLLNAPPRAK